MVGVRYHIGISSVARGSGAAAQLVVGGVWCVDARIGMGVCRYGAGEGQERGVGFKWGAGDMVGALHVAGNDLGAEGATQIAKALTTNSTLTDLNLACE